MYLDLCEGSTQILRRNYTVSIFLGGGPNKVEATSRLAWLRGLIQIFPQAWLQSSLRRS